jgi:hypothetical protein
MDGSLNQDSALPREILSTVFGFLSHHNLATALLVCRLWREVGEDPFLWSQFRIFVKSAQRFLEMTGMSRMAFARKLEMNEKFSRTKHEMKSIFNLVSANGCFKEMDIKLVDGENVDANVLARCLNSLEKVKIGKLSSSQANAVFTGILEETKLKHLDVLDSHLEAIPDKTFTRVVDKLESLKLICCRLTRRQARAVVENMKKASYDAPSDIFDTPDENGNLDKTYNMEVNKDVEYLNIKILDENDGVQKTWAQSWDMYDY